jgi:hypothetical protein
MTTPRRRLIRPAALHNGQPSTAQHVQKLRLKLDKDRRDLARWMSRLKRAFSFVQKHQTRITRLERQITKLEGG